MTHEKRDYVHIIRASGHRVTPQRLLILDAVCEGEGHTTLGEIYARLRAKDRSINRSTVYRALDLFTELGLVVSAERLDGETVYEIARQEPHYHLVCRVCGREQELGPETMEPLLRTVEALHGFQIETDHIVFQGLCADCREAEG